MTKSKRRGDPENKGIEDLKRRRGLKYGRRVIWRAERSRLPSIPTMQALQEIPAMVSVLTRPPSVFIARLNFSGPDLYYVVVVSV